jgi:GH25 family lysozyme M1 (1,4-beta-N-acetylmuramidase)
LKRKGSIDYFPCMNMLRRVTILRAAAAGGAAVALSCALVPDASAATAAPAAPMAPAQAVRGLDISAYQHTGQPINWRQLARDGLRFVSIKAAEGTYYVNPYYSPDSRAAAAAGLAVFPYVFANPAAAGGAPTARFAVGATGVRRGLAAPLVVDLENDPYKNDNCYGLKPPAMTGWIAGFIGQVHALTGRWPVIYTTALWWQQCTGSSSRFGDDALWLAAFAAAPGAVPSPWRQWAFWQYADNGSLPGIGPVDLDYYRPTGGMPGLEPGAQRAAKKHPPAKKHPASRRTLKASRPPAKHPAAKPKKK